MSAADRTNTGMAGLSLRRRAVLWALAAAFGALVVACMGPTFVVQQYDGPVRPQNTIAILRVDAKEPARLLVLDEQDAQAPLIEDARLHIEMLPGPHSLVVANTSAPHERYAPMSFDAAPGRVYRVVFPAGPTGDARVYEVDRGSNALVRDVTGAPKLSAPPPPARASKPPPPVEDAGASAEPDASSDGG